MTPFIGFAVALVLLWTGFTLGFLAALVLRGWKEEDNLDEQLDALERIYRNGNRP